MEGSLPRQFGERLRDLQQERASDQIDQAAFQHRATQIVEDLMDHEGELSDGDYILANADIGLQYQRFSAQRDRTEQPISMARHREGQSRPQDTATFLMARLVATQGAYFLNVNAQRLTRVANSPREPGWETVLSAVGQEVARRVDGQGRLLGFGISELAMLAHGLRKMREDVHCAAGLRAVGREVARRVNGDGRLPQVEARYLVTLVNGLRGLAWDDADCAAVLSAVGKEVASRLDEEGRLQSFNAQNLTVLAYGLGLRPEDEACAAGLNAVRQEILLRSQETSVTH